MTGVDAPFELTRHAISLRQQGIGFAIRYYSHNAQKGLSLAEARALTDADIQIGVVWDAPGNHVNYFSRAQGCADGASAFHMAQCVLGQPSGSAIYFAVDFDASADDIAGPIMQYFIGVAQAFEAAGNDEPHYMIGVVASASCCRALRCAGLAAMSWLSRHGDSAEAADYQSFNLRQLAPASLPVDDSKQLSLGLNRSNDGYPTGFFRIL